MKTKDYKFIIIILMLLSIIAVFLIKTDEEVIIELDDRCGPMMNLISHTIADSSVCKTKCKSQCVTKDLSFQKTEFFLNERGCNNCTCFCK